MPDTSCIEVRSITAIQAVVSLKNSTINEQKNTISKSLNLLDAGHLPSGSYRGG